MLRIRARDLPFSLWSKGALKRALGHRIIPQAQFHLGQVSTLEFGKPSRKLHPSTEVSELPGLFGLKIFGWEALGSGTYWLGLVTSVLPHGRVPVFYKNVWALRP